ncbi:hypothetical protein AB7W91_21705 [Providencia rettgeri]
MAAYTKKAAERPLELIVDAGAELLRVMQSANTGMTRYTAFSS